MEKLIFFHNFQSFCRFGLRGREVTVSVSQSVCQCVPARGIKIQEVLRASGDRRRERTERARPHIAVALLNKISIQLGPRCRCSSSSSSRISSPTRASAAWAHCRHSQRSSGPMARGNRTSWTPSHSLWAKKPRLLGKLIHWQSKKI